MAHVASPDYNCQIFYVYFSLLSDSMWIGFTLFYHSLQYIEIGDGINRKNPLSAMAEPTVIMTKGSNSDQAE